MDKIELVYDPYRLRTKLLINGEPPRTEALNQAVGTGHRLQEWAEQLPSLLCKECVRSKKEQCSFELHFKGTATDYDDIRKSFRLAKRAGLVSRVRYPVFREVNDAAVAERMRRVFKDLMDGPFDEMKDAKSLSSLNNLWEEKFPINVIATMSSGKSTLINALLQHELLPSKNEACTATVTEILDNDREGFEASVYKADGKLFKTLENVSENDLEELNSDPAVDTIRILGDIPFIDAEGIALELVDTPGPNNSREESHKRLTYDAIDGGANNLIIYVLNATQLSTNDDHDLLEYVSKKIKEGGQQARDRFLFVINKMDSFDPEKEDIPETIQNARDYLASFGIEDPILFPCSAYTALKIRTCLRDMDPSGLTNDDVRKLPSETRLALSKMYSLLDFDDMHFEKYSVLTPAARQNMSDMLENAKERNDEKGQALIHSGICSVEEAIRVYVKKYAVTKMIKDTAELLLSVVDKKKLQKKANDRIEKCKKALEKVVKPIKPKCQTKKTANRTDVKNAEQSLKECMFISRWLDNIIEQMQDPGGFGNL